LVLAAAGLVLSGSLARQSPKRGDPAAAATRGVAGGLDTSRPLPRSPAGLMLGSVPLKLEGLNDAVADRVQQYFAKPPRAALLFNLQTGQVLWQLNPMRRLPIASLTKMMTALLVARMTAPNVHVPITREAVNMPGSKVGVLPLHHTVSVNTLMYGLLLPSGNDAAVALAQYVGGSVHRFVTKMNREAARLGLGCTHFSNPSGYYDQDNYSCPADLAELAYADLRQPRVAPVVRSRSAILSFPTKGGKLYLYNNNPLLMYGYAGTNGVKTGYTDASGACLVATAERNGVRLGVVLLHSPAPGTQAQRLLDDGFEQVYRVPPRAEATVPGGA
jgi:D-alanyl-D-alanine carboxypeptidase